MFKPGQRGPALERFQAHHIRLPDNGCWVWKGSLANKGYGRLYHNGENVFAHRFSWRLYNGPINNDLCVLHRCDNRACVNPDHLFLGTDADNCRDRHQKGRTVNVRGERHGRRKLTEQQVKAIRRSKKPGVQLARLYGVSDTTISKIRNRLKWTHN